MSAIRRIDASPEAVFRVLADPGSHAAIDGTGWVCEPLDSAPLTAAGQVFRMAMYHSDHPNGAYAVANEVQILTRPHVISWKPGYDTDDGTLAFGGWVWRYDLDRADDGGTEVTLSYDWSAITGRLARHSPSRRSRSTISPLRSPTSPNWRRRRRVRTIQPIPEQRRCRSSMYRTAAILANKATLLLEVRVRAAKASRSSRRLPLRN